MRLKNILCSLQIIRSDLRLNFFTGVFFSLYQQKIFKCIHLFLDKNRQKRTEMDRGGDGRRPWMKKVGKCHVSGVMCHMLCQRCKYVWTHKQCSCEFFPSFGQICAYFYTVLSRKWVLSQFCAVRITASCPLQTLKWRIWVS